MVLGIYLQDFPDRKSSGEPKKFPIECEKPVKNESNTLPITTNFRFGFILISYTYMNL